MRRIASGLIAAAGLSVVISQVALAADLPQRPVYNSPAVVVAAPVPTWTGCYIGGNAGMAFGRTQISDNTGATVSGTKNGFAGGGQVGCDYQFAGGFVIGIRDMFDGTSLHSSGTFGGNSPFAGSVGNSNTQWFNALTARIGYSVVPAGLIYLQGGGAWIHTSQNITTAGVQTGQISNSNAGWTIGGGYEYKFAPNWSAFLEYNYMNFGTTSGTAIIPGGACAGGCPFSTKSDMQNVLVGVNYRF